MPHHASTDFPRLKGSSEIACPDNAAHEFIQLAKLASKMRIRAGQLATHHSSLTSLLHLLGRNKLVDYPSLPAGLHCCLDHVLQFPILCVEHVCLQFAHV